MTELNNDYAEKNSWILVQTGSNGIFIISSRHAECIAELLEKAHPF